MPDATPPAAPPEPMVVGRIDGRDVLEVALATRAGATARVLTYGATLRDLVVPFAGAARRVVLGLARVEDYPGSPYVGPIVGRFANRIAGGRLALGGGEFQLDRNEGPNLLHGGRGGFSHRHWALVARDAAGVTLRLVSEDGDQGFPGRLTVTARIALLEPATLRFDLAATTEAATVVNLAHHGYFNLMGGGDALDHVLESPAALYTPVGEGLIPTGEVRGVEGTPYDLRRGRRLRDAWEGAPYAYDVNLVLPHPRGAFAPAARLISPDGLGLEVWSDRPGQQVYVGQGLDGSLTDLVGRPIPRHGGVVLETQGFPDAPNRAHFPDPTLRPGAVHRHRAEYRFAEHRFGESRFAAP